MPGGILTVSFRERSTCPRPRHVVQGLGMTVPAPRHCPHVRATVRMPCWNRTWPCPPQGRAPLGLRARLGPLAVAAVARLEPRDLEGGLGAAGCLLERNAQIVSKISSARGAASPTPAKDVAEAEDVTEPPEDVAEVGEDRRVHIGATSGAGDPGVTELVVAPSLLFVREDSVGLGGLLEVLLRGGITGIPVWVVLQRQLAIRALDGARVGRLRHAEHLVVVTLAHALATRTMAARSNRPLNVYPRRISSTTSPSRYSSHSSRRLRPGERSGRSRRPRSRSETPRAGRAVPAAACG